MSRVKAVLVLALLAALFARPLVLDGCAVSCDSTSASAQAAAAPPCHHSEGATTSIGATPRACGHDHHPGAFLAAQPADAHAPLAASFAAVAPVSQDNLRIAPHSSAVVAPSSPPTSAGAGSLLVLRV